MLKQLRECPAAQKWEVHLDPGHAKNNLVNALAAVFGERKEFEGLAMRIPTFIMRCTKAGRRRSTLGISRACVHSFCSGWIVWCPITHKPVELTVLITSRMTSSYRIVLPPPLPTKHTCHPAIHGSQIAMLESIINRMKKSARYFIHGYNTCNTERYHRERLKFTPKQIEFRKTWAPRCALNQLIHNVGYAETHRLVLAKLSELQLQDIPSSEWAKGIFPGNPYVAAMDSQRTYHSTRKSQPEYNRRED